MQPPSDTPTAARKTILAPDIDWVEIPAGPFIYQEGETVELPTFSISRYPITNAQYQTFIDADGYDEGRWWQDLVKPEPEASRWPQPNRPRTDVNWHEAVAFTRWLGTQLGREIRLPTEHEWEKAARGTEGLEYPWGNEYHSGYANVDENASEVGPWYLKQTTAVGLYPRGQSPWGVLDMAGNVWEWCLDSFEPSQTNEINDHHAIRGGSWNYDPADAACSERDWLLSGARGASSGFRVITLRVALHATPSSISSSAAVSPVKVRGY